MGESSSKKPWQSKTIVLNALLGLVAAVALFVPGASGVSTWIQANGPLVATIWSALNIGLRFITKDAVQLTD